MPPLYRIDHRDLRRYRHPDQQRRHLHARPVRRLRHQGHQAGYRGLPGRTAYSASKFALQGWLESLRTELLYSGVNVMWVCPGFTASNIRLAALDSHGEARGETVLNEGSLMTAQECARHILKAIERRRRTLVLTFLGKVTVLINKMAPSLADRLTYRHYYNKKGEFVK
jgi:short-subunit dehydrogenase